ncbi:MAG: succinate dehydrogenase assembly factor 2 [Pseudomonadales bacterium]
MYSELELNRLRWRSRRGMLELDLLLLPFFDQAFKGLPEGQQSVYVRLLEQDDPDLLQWFSRQAEANDQALQAMVEQILARVQP